MPVFGVDSFKPPCREDSYICALTAAALRCAAVKPGSGRGIAFNTSRSIGNSYPCMLTIITYFSEAFTKFHASSRGAALQTAQRGSCFLFYPTTARRMTTPDAGVCFQWSWMSGKIKRANVIRIHVPRSYIGDSSRSHATEPANRLPVVGSRRLSG